MRLDGGAGRDSGAGRIGGEKPAAGAEANKMEARAKEIRAKHGEETP